MKSEEKNKYFSKQLGLLLPDLLKWALMKISIKEDAEDIVQDVFLSAYKKIDTFEEKSSIKTWLFSILNHKIYDYYRKKNRNLNKEEPHADMEKVLFDEKGRWKIMYRPSEWKETVDNEILGFLKDCMNHLSNIQSSLIRYKYFEEWKSDEICNELKLSKTNYWQLTHRIRLQLRKCIEARIKE